MFYLLQRFFPRLSFISQANYTLFRLYLAPWHFVALRRIKRDELKIKASVRRKKNKNKYT